VAIIPNVIKIGFVAGVRRGHGVVVVRDADGQWSLPQFVTLTGGSVGWQVGVQGSDVILVFMTQQSVQGLMSGKFTIGADVAAAAGPVGRNAAAATDGRLQAEILSYSRSRGLFAGLAIDGSVIEVDDTSHLLYYGAPSAQLPQQIPASATKLRFDLASSAQGTLAPAGTVGALPAGAVPVAGASSQLAVMQQSLKTNALQLYALLDSNWQRYLALPREVFEGTHPPSLEALQRAQQQFAQVATQPQYKSLAERPEFQSAYEALQAFSAELATVGQPKLALPPPPPGQ
jgi:lipid-binding SYLF domain-containing protein